MFRRRLTGVSFLVLVLLAGCNSEPPVEVVAPDTATSAPGSEQPLFEGLGPVNLTITTSSQEAQAYFNQGLALAWAFNHAAADLAFNEAARFDPDCAMCYWGSAMVLGPNLNMPMVPYNNARARKLTDMALARLDGVSALERGLIEAMDVRYAAEPPEDRTPLDEAYADAMRALFKAYPEDANVAALTSEALMDLHPWEFWEKDGTERPWTREVTDTIEHALALDENHIGAIHLYIHAVEASNTAHRAEPYADKLADLSPNAGHLVHMPAHIYIRVGRYHDSTINNMKATDADEWFVGACKTDSAIYLGGYIPHNWHFGAITAAIEGWQVKASELAEGTRAQITPQMLENPGFTGSSQNYYMMPVAVNVRFRNWDAIMAEPQPAADLAYANLLWHYARGRALVGQGDLEQAQAELAAVRALGESEQLAGVGRVGRATVTSLLSIASGSLGGEIAAAQGDYAGAIEQFAAAVAVEDSLPYSEPPTWFHAVRHQLGAAQLAAGEILAAEETYRDDLAIWPENGWALAGLQEALVRQARAEEAAAVGKRFETAWQHADTVVSIETGRRDAQVALTR